MKSEIASVPSDRKDQPPINAEEIKLKEKD